MGRGEGGVDPLEYLVRRRLALCFGKWRSLSDAERDSRTRSQEMRYFGLWLSWVRCRRRLKRETSVADTFHVLVLEDRALQSLKRLRRRPSPVVVNIKARAIRICLAQWVAMHRRRAAQVVRIIRGNHLELRYALFQLREHCRKSKLKRPSAGLEILLEVSARRMAKALGIASSYLIFRLTTGNRQATDER